MLILVINTGSSSVKYQVLDMPCETVVTCGLIEQIGGDSRITHKTFGGRIIQKNIAIPDYQGAFQELTALLKEIGRIHAIGHRVVHGGGRYDTPVLITEEVISTIEQSLDFAPLHNGPNLLGIRACTNAFGPDISQVAVFDTAFHKDMPLYASLYPLPYEYYEKHGIRRYGFHGLSHRYASERCAELMGRQDLRIIICHLGNGCSLAAIRNGISIDTTMGFTPNEGMMMGTRSGSIDPSIPAFVAEKEGISYDEALSICNRKAGLLGVSGISNDYRELVNSKDVRASLALEMHRYQILKAIGSYLAVMNGADAIVFTGGIGENVPELRQFVCAGLGYAGVVLDEDANKATNGDTLISGKDSKVAVFVISSHEERIIARDTFELLQ